MSEELSPTVLLAARPIIEAHAATRAAAVTGRTAELAHREVPDMLELRRGLRHAQGVRRAAWEHLQKLQDAECEKFAASRGWRVYNGRQGWVYTDQLIAGRMSLGSRSIYGGFGYPRDAEDPEHVIDHRECFVRSPAGKTSQQSCRYPVAIVSHTYGDWEPCVAYAKRHGLDVERLPFSWYYPGAAIAALFITRASA